MKDTKFKGAPRGAETTPPFQVWFEMVTPERAQALLDTNPGNSEFQNRSISTSRVSRYVDDMLDGFWETTHQGVALDENGVLLDGQHRLMAIVRSGCSARLMICSGVPRATFWLMDGGYTRSAQSFLEGTHRNQRTALARTLMQIEEHDGFATMATAGKGRFASHRILGYLESRSDVREYGEAYARAAGRGRVGERFVGTSAAGLLIGGYIAGVGEDKKIDRDNWLRWWEDVEALMAGDGVDNGNPLKALFNSSPVGGNMTSVNYMRAIYTAVAYREGRSVKRLRSDMYAKPIKVW